jgi:hypothetical protein
MLREEIEGIDARGIGPQTHSRSSKRRRKPDSNRNNHNEGGGVAGDADGAATTTPLGLRSPMLQPLTSCPPLYKKRRIRAEEADVLQAEADEEEVAGSVSHSAWLLVAVNSAAG